MKNERPFELNPDDLLEEKNLKLLKDKLLDSLKIRRNLREKKYQQELFDPSKPQKGKKK
jgi:hypothetical protein